MIIYMTNHEKIYDLIIVGAGPAGLTAAIYASRYGIKPLVISENIGGMAQEAWHVENYPGITKITGKELMKKIQTHAKDLGSEFLLDGVGEILRYAQNDKVVFQLKTVSGKMLKAKTIILALGLKNRRLNITNEEKFLGRGVSYCFTCDGVFFRDKIVAVVGGANSAAHAALTLAEYATKIYILFRKPEMTAQPSLIQEIKNNPKMEILPETQIKELQGNNKLEKIIVYKTNSPDDTNEIIVDGLFIEIGTVPSNILAQHLSVECDEKEYIKVNNSQETNVPGIFAAGSGTNATPQLNQIIVSCSQGALAAFSANLYLKNSTRS